MGIPTGNLHQNREENNHHTKLECEEILPRGDMSSPICTTPMFVDGRTHVEASPSSPHTHACCQQGVDDGKPVSKKCRRNFGGASNLAARLSNFAKSSNKIEILKA
jgi:hypothetical protein